jgi:integrase
VRPAPRRALTEEELTRLLAAVEARPLDDARAVRRGAGKGRAVARLRRETVERRARTDRERALIVKTLVLTGLRVNERRALTVGQVDLTPGRAVLQLDAADEKSREGNTLPARDDLAADLRAWLAENPKPPAELLFHVPAGFLRILDRDLKAAGIPKRDDRFVRHSRADARRPAVPVNIPAFGQVRNGQDVHCGW